MASRSKRLSLEDAMKFVTASDDKEFSEIESSKSNSNSDESNSDYLDVSAESFGGNVKSFLEVDTMQVCLHFCFVFLLKLSPILIFFLCFPKT